jgi:hypothetical protein
MKCRHFQWASPEAISSIEEKPFNWLQINNEVAWCPVLFPAIE